MKNKIIKTVAISLIGVMTLGLTGCGEAATYDGYVFPDQPESSLVAVSDTYVKNPIQFEDAAQSIRRQLHFHRITEHVS